MIFNFKYFYYCTIDRFKLLLKGINKYKTSKKSLLCGGVSGSTSRVSELGLAAIRGFQGKPMNPGLGDTAFVNARVKTGKRLKDEHDAELSNQALDLKTMRHTRFSMNSFIFTL